MSTLTDIKLEIEHLTNRRAELFHLLSEGHDAKLAAEREALEKRLAKAWEEHRIARAQIRFGDPKQIIQRARQEERIDRAA